MSAIDQDPLLKAADADPDGLAVQATSATWTWRELAVATGGAAALLAAAGVRAGSRVAALQSDDAAAVAVIHATRWLGAVLVPLNRRSTAPELVAQVLRSSAVVLVHDEPSSSLARSISEGATEVSLLNLGHRLGPRQGRSVVPAEVDPAALATIVFTSGTGGRPKAALLSHGSHAASARAWADHLRPQPTDRWLACLPLFHVAGLAIVLRAALWSVPLVVHRGFDATVVWEAIDGGVTHLSLVPTQLRALLEQRSGRGRPESLRALLLGGGPIPPEDLAGADAAGLPVVTTYGMTETASGVAVGDARSKGAVKGLPGVELRLASDPVGEVLIRGPMLFDGYLDDPEATHEALQDGWLRSGDIGRFIGPGWLRIEDRRTDLLISGGENVYPAEVEAVLLGHPDVVDAAVVGRADPRWGAVPVAAIVPRPGRPVSDATLAAHCRERLAAYKVPVAFARVERLPRNSAGKLQRRDVRAMLLEEPD